MKPSWNDAPEWANYLAQDRDGVWYWYENKPELDKGADMWDSSGKSKQAPNHSWESTLEKNPNNLPESIWDILPSWVNYIAMDEDGSWFCYEAKPQKGDNSWHYGISGRYQILDNITDWELSLIKKQL